MVKKMLISLFLIGVILGSYALFIEPNRLVITERDVKTSKWTHDKPLKIALIADVHAIWPWMTPRHIKRIITKTNELKPDLILLLGDYVSTHPFGIQPNAVESYSLYNELQSKCGTYSVIGNHDLHGSVGWLEALRNSDIPLLENEAIKLNCNGQDFWLAGLEDLWWQDADIKKTLDYVKDDDPIILMMHNPDSFVDVPNNIALSVAGHTHAGQIRFPILVSVESVVPSKYGKRFEYGHIKNDNKDLVVSGGLGTTGIPLRFMNPPEVVIVNLQNNSTREQ